jgi:hypothetical protein
VVIPSLPRRIVRAAIAVLALMAGGCHRAPESGSDPQPAADAFFAMLESGNARGAYDGSAFAFQAGQTFDGFLSNAEDLSLIGGQPPQWDSSDLHDSQATLKGTLVNHVGGAIPISVTMTKEDGAWKLFSLRTATGPGDASQENHFTTVGKGAGFNDVYHQPMPDPKQLDILIHKTMAQFNDAIRRGDFQAFYNNLSAHWRSIHSDTGAILGGVSPNILKSHFQGFIDRKIDLSPVAYVEPVYDAPTHINEGGQLETQGHFDVAPLRVEFTFIYVYEMPWWKLDGMNIGIRNRNLTPP